MGDQGYKPPSGYAVSIVGVDLALVLTLLLRPQYLSRSLTSYQKRDRHWARYSG